MQPRVRGEHPVITRRQFIEGITASVAELGIGISPKDSIETSLVASIPAAKSEIKDGLEILMGTQDETADYWQATVLYWKDHEILARQNVQIASAHPITTERYQSIINSIVREAVERVKLEAEWMIKNGHKPTKFYQPA